MGFSTWLARSRLPAEPAPGYRLAIERFLRWCDSEGRHLAEHRRPWVYCRWLQRTGASESGLATARTALFLFDRYSVLGGGWDAPDPAPATPARHRLP
ncbi:MAG TPA: hypothetical protein VGH99_14615 [Pseudonocardia sp.]